MADDTVYDSSLLGWQALHEFKQVVRYRELLYQLVRRDLLTRYKRSFLGIAWTMLNPLGMMVVLSTVFSHVFKSQPALPVYILSGTMTWSILSAGISGCIANLVWGDGLIKKVYLPKTVFAISAISSQVVNWSLALVPLLVVMAFYPVHYSWALISLPLAVLLLGLFSLGIGLLISILAVYFPDTSDLSMILLTVWMYLTPVFYPINILPHGLMEGVINYNPMYCFISLVRYPITMASVAPPELWLKSSLYALASAAIGWTLFTKLSKNFATKV